jgi:DNA-binding Lrp family transcriptional regulator
MSEADELILKILRLSNKALSAKKIENALGIEIGEKVSRRTLNYRLEKLVSLGLLKPVLSDLKQAAYMPMDRYKEWTDIKFQERKIHSDELKEEVIKPWIDQLPKVSGALILVPSPVITINEYTGEVKLDVEKHDLFGDLEYHLDPDVFDRWERFKDLVMEYTERRNQILSEIEESLERARAFYQ